MLNTIKNNNEIYNIENLSFLNKTFQEKILQVKRVTKVVKGGKKLSFSALVAVGDYKKFVGIGLGKGDDVNTAIEKGVLNAKKSLINIPLTHSSSIPKALEATFGASKIILRPAKLGTGIIAGSSIRTILELAGIKNIVSKQLGSNNLLNNAKACMLVLSLLSENIEITTYKSTSRQNFYRKILGYFFKQFKKTKKGIFKKI